MKSLLLFLLLLSCHFLSAQDDPIRSKLIKSISEYRSKLLLEDQENLKQLNETINTWKTVEPDTSVVSDLIFQVQYARTVLDMSIEEIQENISKKYPESKLSSAATEGQINSLAQNTRLIDLINLGILTEEYPHQIYNNKKLYEELEFYSIGEGESIADVGGGRGVLSMLLFMMDQSNKIYLTEVDDQLIEYNEVGFGNTNLGQNSSDIFLVKGGKSETNLPEKVDKIIVRKTFHHFKRKKKMLKSIKNSLKPSGKLYINEYPTEEKNPSGCKHRMKESEIRSILENNGFRDVREIRLGGQLIIEYEAVD